MRSKSEAELIRLIESAINKNTETDSIEFKDARGGLPDDIWKSITGFSNKQSGGGIIVFGVHEDKATRHFSVSHLANIHELQEKCTSYTNDRIVNCDRPEYHILQVKGEDVLVMALDSIQEEKKPCFDSRKGMDRGAYIRDGNTDRPITDDELRHFIRNSSAFKYDLTPVDNFTVADLDNSKIIKMLTEMAARTRRESISNEVTETVLKNTSIAVDTEYGIRPTIAGVLVFNSANPQEKSPFNRYAIRCIRYAGSTPASPIIDNLDIVGTLDEQINSMQSFVLKNIPRTAVIQGTQRVEKYAYPEEAIREILANAAIHRDYSITETYTQVRVFSDRIEVLNPGNLPPGVTVDNIKEVQFSRNAIIASLMRDLNYLEEYGRGIDIAFSNMREFGLPRPIFRNAANMFTVTLLGKQFKDLTERQLQAWQLILNKSRVTAKVVAESLNVSKPTAISDLNRLMSLNLIAPSGSGPSTSYEIGSTL